MKFIKKIIFNSLKYLSSLDNVSFFRKFGLTILYITSIGLSFGFAQSDVSGRIPVYEVPYVYPSEEKISEVLNRIRIYYESTSSRKVVDRETGEEITKFKKKKIYQKHPRFFKKYI